MKFAYTELILSIDGKAFNGKIAFNIVKGCKTKDYLDAKTASHWEKLKNKYEPFSVPSTITLD
jgi:hypothetical protein